MKPINKELSVTRQIEIQYADGKFETTFTLIRQEWSDRSESRYRLNAIVSTGFDLTVSSYGVLNPYFDANKRLRSPKSILGEMNTILDDIIEYTSINLNRFIVKTLTVKQTLTENEWQFFKETDPFPTCSIKSFESGNPISWYYHDVFNTETPIEITFSRKPGGQLTAHASEASLYDFKKLQHLASGERFKKQNYAFFFYNEVKRLLGQSFEGSNEAMSGLIARGGS